MAKITKIKPQKSPKGRSASGRTQDRFNLYLDGKFAFGLPIETLAKVGLVIGQEISERELEKLRKKDIREKLYNKALKFLSYRPRSEKEIRDYLEKRSLKSKAKGQKWKGELVGEVIRLLKKQKLVDDLAFTSWWLEQRATFRPRGKFALKAELRQKGISREIIEKALAGINEIVLAQKAAAKKRKSYQKLSPREFRQKMSAFLSRRGFSWEVIREVLDQEDCS